MFDQSAKDARSPDRVVVDGAEQARLARPGPAPSNPSSSAPFEKPVVTTQRTPSSTETPKST